LERSVKLRKLPQGVSTGLILGALCLAGALGFWIFAPDFSGLVERKTDAATLPVWAVLAILALVNFAYAGLSGLGAAARRQNPSADNEPEEPNTDQRSGPPKSK
jgi:hypothetical protein